MAMAKKHLAAKAPLHALLTGPPGVGKTTLIRKVSAALQENGIDLHGFFTEEVRSSQAAGRGGGPRIGFDVVTFDGKRGPLARVGRLCRFWGACSDATHAGGRKPIFVGKYQVDVAAFEQIALPTLQMSDKKSSESTGSRKRLVVIDEIGKMELFSRAFVDSVKGVFQHPSVVVVATIPIARHKSHWLVEELRHREDCQLFEVTERNRQDLVKEIQEYLLDNLSTAYSA